MSEHRPVIRPFDAGSVGVSCDCGWIDPYLWGHAYGARQAYLEHVVRAHTPATWLGSVDVTCDWEDEG